MFIENQKYSLTLPNFKKAEVLVKRKTSKFLFLEYIDSCTMSGVPALRKIKISYIQNLQGEEFTKNINIHGGLCCKDIIL